MINPEKLKEVLQRSIEKQKKILEAQKEVLKKQPIPPRTEEEEPEEK